MASPLASTSRHMLGMRLRSSGRVVVAKATAASSASTSSSSSFSTSTLRLQDGQQAATATTTATVLDPTGTSDLTGSPLTAPPPSSSESDLNQHSAEQNIDSVAAQAAQKAYYDNLEATERREAVEEQRKKLQFKAARLKHLETIGSTQNRATSFRPHHQRLTPVTARELTVSHLLAATAHVGHARSSLNNASVGFVYGTRHGQAIIDVERFTLPALRLACKIVKDIVFRDGVVVFVGTAEGTEAAVLAAAKRLGKNGFHVTGRRWLPGTLTNAPKVLARAILSNAATYESYVEQEQAEEAERMARRDEQRQSRGQYVTRRRNQDVTENAFDPVNLASQRLKPDLMIVLNPKNNQYAINEATQAGVPTIGIIDTDVDPRLVTYAIPANDESIRTAELVVGVLSKAGQDGLEARRQWDDELSKRQSQAARQARSMSRRREEETEVDEEHESSHEER